MPIKAAVMTGPRKEIELWELDDPTIEPGGVLLETVASEVCGTDVHLHHGRLAGVPYPIVPGHISVGRVLEADGVDSDSMGVPLARGDVVTFYDVHETCHACYYCTVAEQPNRCPQRRVYGITYSADEGPLGGWAERIYLKPGVQILRLPDSLSADDVIGGGCGLFTGFAAVERSDLAMGDTVLVQGTGPVGLSAIAFAMLRGAGKDIAIGDPEALSRPLADASRGTQEQVGECGSIRRLPAKCRSDALARVQGDPPPPAPPRFGLDRFPRGTRLRRGRPAYPRRSGPSRASTGGGDPRAGRPRALPRGAGVGGAPRAWPVGDGSPRGRRVGRYRSRHR